MTDEHFNRRLDGNGGGFQYWCKECINEYHSAAGGGYGRKRKYGLSKEDINQMLIRQEYRCAIMGEPITIESCKVDHDHNCCPQGDVTCGKCVRGLLCVKCNAAMYGFDRKDFAYRANIYVLKYWDSRTPEAQLEVQCATNAKDAGSNPAGSTNT